MGNLMHTTPTGTSATSDALAVSALQTTREAIARWSGKTRPTNALPREPFRISPQALWFAETQRGLAAFIEHGGFAQFEGARAPLPPILRPTMFKLDHAAHMALQEQTTKACME